MTSSVALATADAPAKVQPIIAPPKHDVILAQARIAFDEEKKGVAFRGTAEQRMTYASQCAFVEGAAAGNMPFILADVLTNSDTRKTVTARLADMFFGEKPDTKDMGDERAATMEQEYLARMGLLRRAVSLAGILAKFGVNFTHFDVAKGVYSVWPIMLFPQSGGTSPVGRLAKDKTIALDNRPIIWNGKTKNGKDDKTFKAKTSLAHLRSICVPPTIRKPRTGATITAGATFNPKSAKDVVDTCPADTVCDAFFMLMLDNEPAGTWAHDMLTPARWMKLTKLMQRFDESRKVWAENKSSAPVAKGKRKAA
jgi:hypothetical protein